MNVLYDSYTEYLFEKYYNIIQEEKELKNNKPYFCLPLTICEITKGKSSCKCGQSYDFSRGIRLQEYCYLRKEFVYTNRPSKETIEKWKKKFYLEAQEKHNKWQDEFFNNMKYM